MKHVHLLSKPVPAQGEGGNLDLLVVLISPFLFLYSAVGQVVRLFAPDFQKSFIGPDQAP